MKLEGGKRISEGPVPSPLVSIITVVFRAKDELLQVIDNIKEIKNEKIEFIVIDGGSADDTLDLLRQNDANIDYWLSEPDKGIYDAMNKGIAAARGTFVFHLNAGDRLIRIPFDLLERAAKENVAAAAFRVSIDGKREFRPKFGWSLRCNNTLHHQGTFFRREQMPAYDTRYKIFADFDANQRLALQGSKVAIYDEVVAFHASGGLSDVATPKTVAEFFDVIYKNHGRHYVALSWVLCKFQGIQRRLFRLVNI